MARLDTAGPPRPGLPSPRGAALGVALALLAAGLAGCADTFTPPSVVEDLRVLALVATPPEVGLGESVSIQPVLAAPRQVPGAPPAITQETWTFCPFSLGAGSGYACAVPACEVPLTPAGGAPGGPVTVDPMAEALACLDLLGGTLPGDLTGAGLPAQVEVLVRYVVTDGTTRREAVQRIPVTTTGLPAHRNQAPVITGVTVGGQEVLRCGTVATPVSCPASTPWDPAARLPVTVSIDPTSIEPFVDGTGRSVTETVVVSFFTSAGRFTDERGQAPLATTELKDESVPGGTTQVLLWVVARDLRGGEAAAGPFLVTR